jgi:hypothetical protein
MKLSIETSFSEIVLIGYHAFAAETNTKSNSAAHSGLIEMNWKSFGFLAACLFLIFRKWF